MRKAIKLLTKQILKAKELGKPKLFIQTLQQQLDKLIGKYGKDKTKN